MFTWLTNFTEYNNKYFWVGVGIGLTIALLWYLVLSTVWSVLQHKPAKKTMKKAPEFTQGQKVYVIKDYKNGVIKTCDLLSVHKDYTGEIDDYTLGVWNSKGTIIHLENVKKEQVFASLEEASNAYLQFREHFGHILDHLEDGK